MANKDTIQVKLQAIMDVSNVQNNVKQIQNVINQLKLPDNLKRSFGKTFGDLENQIDKASDSLNKGFKTKGDITNFSNTMNKINSLMMQLQGNMQKVDTKILTDSFTKNSAAIKEMEQQLLSLQNALTNAIPKTSLSNIQSAITNIAKVSKDKSIEKFQKAFEAGDIEEASAAFAKLNAKIDTFKNAKNKESYSNFISTIKQELDALEKTNVSDLNDQINTLTNNIANASDNQLKEFVAEYQKLASQSITQQINEVNTLGKNLFQTASSTQQLNAEVEQLGSRVKNFFSLTNSVYLFKRAINEAINTIKELDATMTETAVVTNFNISDMWDQLPEYTKRANELGISINSAYEAATLYYQQGLNTNQVMAVSNETLKMARIAGLDAADATDKMTAALRGFNMEINETSAQRVNDVYSELAAITASDVEEISTAMTKTASIAKSANMEFETTAAFLSQIIETTRESAETAGTALKTVIARFTELKKDPSEIGEIDGEVVDANKIETALRTVGVALRDAQGQFRDLDDVFLELASKWDSLDTNTQRYIATMAAGSRQQSRFIAMMSDYDRTMELVTAANNSAGASQQQFEKTTESLQSKLNKLQNTWDEFTMGIANSTVVKGVVDILTSMMTIINKLTNNTNSLVRSVSKLALSFGLLKGGKTLLNGFYAGLVNAKEASSAGANISTIMLKSIKEQFAKDKIQLFTKDFWIGQFDSEAVNQSLKTKLEDIKSTVFADIADYDPNELQKKQTELEKILGSNIKTQNLYNAALELGASEETKNAIATGKCTLEIIAKDQALNDDTRAQLANIYQQKSGLLVQNKQIILTGLQKLANNELTKSTLIGIAAKKLSAKVEAAGLAGQLAALGVTAGLALAILGIAKAIKVVAKAVKENSISARLEAAKKKTEELKSTANDAADAYKNIFTTIDDYADKVKVLDNYIKGTQEWYAAIQDVNNSVLDLIDKYPELAQYLEITDGLMSLKDGWENFVISSAQQNAQNTQRQYLASAGYEQYLQSKQASKSLNDLGTIGTDSAANFFDRYYSNKDFFKEINDKLNSGETIEGLTKTQFDNLKSQYDQARTQKTLADNQSKSYWASAIQTSLDQELQNFEYGDIDYSNAIQSMLGNVFDADDINKQIDENTTNLKWNNTKKQLQKKYVEIFGGTVEDIQDMSKDALARAISTNNVSKDKQKKANELVKQFETAIRNGQTGAQGYLGILSGQNVTKSMLDSLGDLGDITELRQKLEQIGVNTSEISNEDLQDAIDFADSANKFFEELAKSLEGIGADNLNSILSNLDYSIAQDLQEKLQYVFNVSGKAGVNALSDTINQIIESNNLTAQEQTKFFNILSATDWTSIDSINQLSSAMKEMGLNIDQVDLKNISTQLIDVAKAGSEFNLDKLKTAIQTVKELIDDIQDREDTERSFDEDTYNKLIEYLNSTGEDWSGEFVWDGNQYTYIGDSLDELTIALDKNTNALIQNQNKTLQQQIETGLKWDEWYQAGGTEKTVIDRLQEGTFSMAADIKQAVIAMLKESYSEGSINDYVNAKDWDSLQSLLNTTYTNDYGYNGQTLASNQDKAKRIEELPYSTQKTGQGVLDAGNDIDAQSRAIEKLIKTTEGAEEEYKALQKVFNDSNSEIAKNTTLIKANAADVKLQQKELDNLRNSATDYSKALEEMGDSSNEWKKMVDSAQKVFGAGIDEDFIKDNLKLFQQMADEDEQIAENAYNQIQQLVYDKLINGQQWKDLLQQAGNEADELQATLGEVIANVKVNGTMDVTDVIQKISDTYKYGTDAFNNVIDLFEKLTGTVITFNTKEDDKGNLSIVGALATKLTNSGNKSLPTYNWKGGGGSGSSGGSSNTYENDYDRFYNLIEDIAEEERFQSKLQKELNRLINKRSTNAVELYSNIQSQKLSLQNNRARQAALASGYLDEIRNTESKYSDLLGYAHYNYDDNTIEINWDAIDKITDETLGKRVDELISGLEDNQSKMDKANDALEDIDDQIEELNNYGKDQAIDLENRVFNALVKQYQDEIDALSDINDSIEKADSNLIDAIQKNINKLRQDRQNEKTEAELGNKQSRLNYLRGDTSGANAVEIKQLEKELQEEQQDYLDNLIDQKISELEDQNQEAADQRKRQIELASANLDWQQKNGQIWEQTYALINTALATNGALDINSQMVSVLKNADSWSALSTLQKQTWLEDLEDTSAQAFAWIAGNADNYGLNDIYNNITNIVQALGSIQEARINTASFTGDTSGSGGSGGNPGGNPGATNSDTELIKRAQGIVGAKQDGIWGNESKTKAKQKFGTDDWKMVLEYAEEDGLSPTNIQNKSSNTYAKSSNTDDEDGLSKINKVVKYKWRAVINKVGGAVEYQYPEKEEAKTYNTEEEAQAAGDEYKKKHWLSMLGTQIQVYKAYKTGGIADFTGPAWLDGTKSHPELVLNQTDTQNFIQLKDILSDIMKNGFSTDNSQTYGDAYYNFDIQVGSLSDDLSINDLVDKIKNKIVSSSNYRNVNAINFMR